MALSDLWSRKGRGGGSNIASVNLDEFDTMLKDYDLIEVNDTPGQQFAIVAPRAEPLSGELGSTSISPFTSHTRKEYNTKLQGLRGLEQYDKMRKSDGTVRGTLRLIKTPVLSARWFIEPGGDRLMDKKAAQFIWKNLTGGLMTIGWNQVLQESLLMLDFGYYMFETVYYDDLVDVRGFGQRTVLRKLAPRHPMDVDRWVFDANGGPVGVWMNSTPAAEGWFDSASGTFDPVANVSRGLPAILPGSSPYPGMTNIPSQNVSGIPNMPGDEFKVYIPIEKLLVFSFDREAGNIEGTSVLRSAYKHWYYKEQLYKIDAIQKERHGIGIPLIKLPMGYKDEDKRTAENLGRNIRTNERAHIVLPPGWELSMLKLEGNPVDCLESVKHHDDEIEKNIVAHFLDKTSSSNTEVLSDMFLKSVRYVADIVCETFNLYSFPRLTAFNYAGAEVPKLKVRRIGESADWRTLSFALRNLIGAGVVVPDDRLEETMRDEMDLPEADPDTSRVVATPQSGPGSGGPNNSGPAGARPTPTAPGLPRVGPPRQPPVNRQRNTRGLPKGDAGQDSSGGK